MQLSFLPSEDRSLSQSTAPGKAVLIIINLINARIVHSMFFFVVC